MPAQTQPLIRGFMCKTMLDSLRKLPLAQQRKILALIPAPVLALMESSAKLGWVVHEERLKVLDATHRVLGDPHFRRFLSGMSEETVNYPLLQSFFQGAVRLFGLTPQALFKWSPYAWEQVTRDSGALVYRPVREATTNGKVELELKNCPPALLRSGSLAEVLAGGFEMLLRRTSKTGRVEILQLDAEGGRVRYEISWE